ncbi:MAG: tail fiber domain-containing protein [Thermaurantimonas sp.]|uniref:tail fiber domain-containing protein n=1 Tax=Schleiferiaceae TaxID=1333713 RepID=UPI00391D0C97
MKNAAITLLLTFFTLNAGFSQLKVTSEGSVSINSYAPNWGRALRTTVHYPQTCAYHLTYLNKDRFYVCAEGWLWVEKGGYFGSDLKIKQNVKKISSPLSTVFKLNGIQFTFIDEENSLKSTSSNTSYYRLGLIAQEVEQVLPGIVKTMPDGSKAIAYTDLIALVIEAIKEQQLYISNLKNEIQELKEQIASNKTQSANIAKGLPQIVNSPLVFQNKPNPFNQSTEINYFLPDTVKSAHIFIYDVNGAQLKKIPIENKGEGSVILHGAELKAGMYHYVLIVNGQIVDSKKMILTD